MSTALFVFSFDYEIASSDIGLPACSCTRPTPSSERPTTVMLSEVATSLKGTSLKGLTVRGVRDLEDLHRWYMNHASAASKRKAAAAPIPIPTSEPVLSPDEWVVEAGILENREEDAEDGDVGPVEVVESVESEEDDEDGDGDVGPVEVVESIGSEEAVEIVEGSLDVSRPAHDGKG